MYYLNTLSVTPNNNNDILKADSGPSTTYLKPAHTKSLINTQKLKNGPQATLPDNTKI